MIKSNLSILSFFLLFISCQPEQEKKKDPYPIKEGQKIEYNNEYLKVTEEESQKKPQRLINENAVLNLGEVEFTWAGSSKKITAFRKGGTDLHFSKKGVTMRISDMYDFSLTLNVFHEKDPFGVGSQSFQTKQGKNNSFEVYIEDEWQVGLLDLISKDAVMMVEELKASTGEVKLVISGTALNKENQEKQPFTLKTAMRFEEITSTIRPS
jgi:hypothetical protein